MAGESGCGKSTAAIAMMGLLPSGARVSGSILYRNRQLVGLPAAQLREVRGREIAMVFQETITALNPVVRVGDQLLRAVRAHAPLTPGEALDRVTRSLLRVRLHDTQRVLASYPSELSGGMCQRVLIAMAIACGSKLLLADEPTTALDVSVQREILTLLKDLAAQGIGILLISHDLAVLSEVASRLVVLYAGEVVEEGPTHSVIRRPRHPYSRALLACVPRLHGSHSSFVEIPEGRIDAGGGDEGCRFRTRCGLRAEICEERPALHTIGAPSQRSRCWRAPELMAD
ncbi:MAG: ABC transporter ATP-binding protein [Bosea sp.]|nr:ABC transporter ATP-binding protein [Bosea sp. (in: a-proteobacteria)]